MQAGKKKKGSSCTFIWTVNKKYCSIWDIYFPSNNMSKKVSHWCAQSLVFELIPETIEIKYYREKYKGGHVVWKE